jgi:hypothetical protein
MKLYELRQIIKTTIKEVLNEQKEINENRFLDSLKNPFFSAGKNKKGSDPILTKRNEIYQEAIKEIDKYNFHNLFIKIKDDQGTKTYRGDEANLKLEINLKLDVTAKELPTLKKIMPKLFEKNGESWSTNLEKSSGVIPANFLFLADKYQNGKRMISSEKDSKIIMKNELDKFLAQNPKVLDID